MFEPIDAAVQLVHRRLGWEPVGQERESVAISYIPLPTRRQRTLKRNVVVEVITLE